MNTEKIIIAIISLINSGLLIFAVLLYQLSDQIGLFFILFPTLIALATYYRAKKTKGFETLKSLKHANIAFLGSFLIPLGLLILYIVITAPMTHSEYGIPPGQEKLMNCQFQCQAMIDTLRTNHTLQECINKCMG